MNYNWAAMTIKSLLFDFDGLILDTETLEIDIWKSTYSEFGFEFPLQRTRRGVYRIKISVKAGEIHNAFRDRRRRRDAPSGLELPLQHPALAVEGVEKMITAPHVQRAATHCRRGEHLTARVKLPPDLVKLLYAHIAVVTRVLRVSPKRRVLSKNRRTQSQRHDQKPSHMGCFPLASIDAVL